MKSPFLVMAGLLIAAGPTIVSSQTQVEKVIVPVVVTGEVIRYEPGRILVVRSEGVDLTYNLSPTVTIPADVQLGRNVSVYSERGKDGITNVTRVTSTAVTPQGELKRTTEETRVGSSGEVRQKTTTVTGEVVSFVPGRNIVIRSDGGETMTMTLAPGVTLPAETQVGKKVTLHTEYGPDGATTVSRVMTTTITPEGDTKRTVEETRTKPTGESTKTTTITVQGKVQTYLPGKSITVLRSDGTQGTYPIAEGAKLPGEIPAGKVVTIRTIPGGSVETIIIEKE
jgi:hypothetical protein